MLSGPKQRLMSPPSILQHQNSLHGVQSSKMSMWTGLLSNTILTSTSSTTSTYWATLLLWPKLLWPSHSTLLSAFLCILKTLFAHPRQLITLLYLNPLLALATWLLWRRLARSRMIVHATLARTSLAATMLPISWTDDLLVSIWLFMSDWHLCLTIYLW